MATIREAVEILGTKEASSPKTQKELEKEEVKM